MDTYVLIGRDILVTISHQFSSETRANLFVHPPSSPSPSPAQMDSYINHTPHWPHTTSFNQLADDDFLALLQKQFPTPNTVATFTDGVNPQNISHYSLPSITPPSEDSSPSPPNMNGDDDLGDSVLKRKASDEDLDESPNQKSQNTCKFHRSLDLFKHLPTAFQ